MSKRRRKPIKSAEDENIVVNSSTVLGTFEGECADSNITNKNGLDITREVWETLFDSEDYKTGIELGHYIGFLGHPDDPGDQNFEHACIVMTEGHIDNDGKIYGKFNLIDTPVGRIVKSFIDAGVTFGISVRGAGDIIDNSVDPDTFVFRGFDLVTFPAYPEAIPTFTEIAASSDIEKQKKYKAVCAAVKTNIDGLNTCEAVEILQSQFAKQSDEYQMLEEQKKKIASAEAEDVPEEEIDISEEKIEGMTKLYKAKARELKAAQDKIAMLESKIACTQSTYKRKIRSMERIMSAQTHDLQDEIFATVQASQVSKAATRRLKEQNAILQSRSSKLQRENSTLKESNLKYKQKIEATTTEIEKKDSVIAKLQSELHETVMASEDLAKKSSNRDATIKELRQDISAANQLIQDYQDAYANLYANALGVHVDNVSVTSTTTVDDLKSIISSTSVSQNTSATLEPTHVDEIVSDYDVDDLVTI